VGAPAAAQAVLLCLSLLRPCFEGQNVGPPLSISALTATAAGVVVDAVVDETEETG
jgi:hypothetical protein